MVVYTHLVHRVVRASFLGYGKYGRIIKCAIHVLRHHLNDIQFISNKIFVFFLHLLQSLFRFDFYSEPWENQK